MRDDLLVYYERELAYLRQMGAEFAQRYPKIAARLQLEPTRCEDPHVERLVEAFAFLAARVHLKLDDEFPEFTQSLLGILFPHFTRPIPSLSVAEFHLDSERGTITGGIQIPRHTMLFSRSVGGVRLQFRTGFALPLWPVRITSCSWITPEKLEAPFRSPEIAYALRVQLSCAHGVTFSELGLDSLRFFLNGEAGVVYPLYEMLAGRCRKILLRDPAPPPRRPILLPGKNLQPCGFSAEEALLPYPRRVFDGYRLLQEYFAFPEKFLFVELSGLDALARSGFGDTLEIAFLCEDAGRSDWGPTLQAGVTERTLRTNCVTLANLFPHTADPINVDQARYDFRINPDARQPEAYEIFQVEQVAGVNPEDAQVVEFQPFYAVRHSAAGRQPELFYHTSRRSSTSRLDENTDVWISLVDTTGKPRTPAVETITARCLCTNRELPSRMPFGDESGDLEVEGSTPVTRVELLRKPTPTVRPALGGLALWQLISQLSLNYLSLVEEGREALQEILRLYASTVGNGERQIDGIAALTSQRHFSRVVGEYGISFVRGIQVRMELDEEDFVGSGAYLFSSLLDRFLGLYVNLNGFSQLEVYSRTRREVIRRWPARSGYGILL